MVPFRKKTRKQTHKTHVYIDVHIDDVRKKTDGHLIGRGPTGRCCCATDNLFYTSFSLLWLIAIHLISNIFQFVQYINLLNEKTYRIDHKQLPVDESDLLLVNSDEL